MIWGAFLIFECFGSCEVLTSFAVTLMLVSSPEPTRLCSLLFRVATLILVQHVAVAPSTRLAGLEAFVKGGTYMLLFEG